MRESPPRRPRHVIPVAQDNAPTPERASKSDLRREGRACRIITTVQHLYEAGDIGDDEQSAAYRWYQESIFAEYGEADFLHLPRERGYVRGDVHTFGISRGQARARISEIASALGACAHIRLEMMLLREWSLTTMGSVLYPAISASRARTKIGAQCALVLEQLSEWYRDEKRRRKDGLTARAPLDKNEQNAELAPRLVPLPV